MLNSIKSNFVLKIIFENIGKNVYLHLLKYNRQLQSKLDLSINTYKEYYELYHVIKNISNKKIYYFCLYLIDFILSDINLMKYKKSLITASCYYIAKANLVNINTFNVKKIMFINNSYIM